MITVEICHYQGFCVLVHFVKHSHKLADIPLRTASNELISVDWTSTPLSFCVLISTSSPREEWIRAIQAVANGLKTREEEEPMDINFSSTGDSSMDTAMAKSRNKVVSLSHTNCETNVFDKDSVSICAWHYSHLYNLFVCTHCRPWVTLTTWSYWARAHLGKSSWSERKQQVCIMPWRSWGKRSSSLRWQTHMKCRIVTNPKLWSLYPCHVKREGLFGHIKIFITWYSWAVVSCTDRPVIVNHRASSENPNTKL